MPKENRLPQPDANYEGIRFLKCNRAGLSYLLAVETDAKDPYHIGTEQDLRWNHIQECLLLLVSPGETVLDIGANIGVVTIPLAASGAEVIAYEVLSENVRFLKAALRANRFEDRVTVRNVAAWEATTRLPFTGTSAWGRFFPGGKATHDAVAIDTDLPPATNVAAVKLDVEGSEVHALRGMRELLRSQRPHIVFESNSLELGRLGSSTTMLFDYLKQFGYRFYRIYDRRRLLRSESYPQESGVADFLATRLNSWQLRRRGFRVGALRSRHIVRRIAEWGDERWPDHLHLLAVIDKLPNRVKRDRRVAGLVDQWRRRYRYHPYRQTIQSGVFGLPPQSSPEAPKLPLPMKRFAPAMWPIHRLYSSKAGRRQAPPPCLWSKGWSQSCDVRGSDSYWLEDTESVQSDAFFRRHYADANGLVWVRLGSRAHQGVPCDLDAFVRAALPTIRKPFSLITTDGDISVPSDLPRKTVDALLECPWLVSWHTQNYDGYEHSKLAPIPIGLDLHTHRFLSSPKRLVSRLRTIAERRLPLDEMPLRVLCDLGVSLGSQERRDAVAALRGCNHVDVIHRRKSQAAIWKHYARYPFVVSAEGNGLDCHRTWELLYLGCIVITRPSSIDPLFEGLPVVLVDDWREVRDKANLAKWLRQYKAMADRDRIWRRLQPEHYVNPIREALAAAEARVRMSPSGRNQNGQAVRQAPTD